MYAGFVALLGIIISCSDVSSPDSGPPEIIMVSVPDSLETLDVNISAIIQAHVQDPDGLNDIKLMQYVLRLPDGTLSNNGRPSKMYDDGTEGDETATDGIYSRKITFTSAAMTGIYVFMFQAQDKAGGFAAEVSDSLWLTKKEEEPNLGPSRIIGIDMPDSLQIPETTAAALIRAEVEDPDGLQDVASVYFYSLKPDGTQANGGNPITMYDDATNGDETAHDGIYSTGIMITNTSLPGRYIFTFYALDKAGNLSDAKTDSIEVYE